MSVACAFTFQLYVVPITKLMRNLIWLVLSEGQSGPLRPQNNNFFCRVGVKSSFLNPESTPEFATICPEEPTPEQAEYWEVAREQACRLSWRPYMHYPALPNLLSRLKNLPTQIIWGREDPIVPLSAGQLYNDSIPGSQLAVIDNAGHRPEIEQTDEFVRIVQEFLSG